MPFFNKKNQANNISNRRDRQEGFTLVEMMVSMMIFSLAMTIVGQLFFYSLKMQRQMAARTKLINELAYSMERISRGLRMAQKDAAGACIAQNENYEWSEDAYGDHIKFQTPDTSFVSGTPIDCVEYYLGHPAGYPTGVVALLEARHNEGGAFSDFTLPLTSPGVDIQSFAVKQYGWSQDDTVQPRVIIHIKALDPMGQELEVQMTVSQRNIDIRY
jgi:prepilin-type N-terminal cleavage/methylation domain-containing protein